MAAEEISVPLTWRRLRKTWLLLSFASIISCMVLYYSYVALGNHIQNYVFNQVIEASHQESSRTTHNKTTHYVDKGKGTTQQGSTSTTHNKTTHYVDTSVGTTQQGSTSTTHNKTTHYVDKGKGTTQHMDYLPSHPYVTQRMVNELKKTRDCGKMVDEPGKWWRTTQLGVTFSADEDLARIAYALGCGGQMLLPNYTATPPRDSLYSFEEEYLRYPPLANLSDVISESNTVVKLLNKSQTYVVGDRVSVLIQARDFHNKPRTRGGDEIRAWLKTPAPNGSSNKVAAYITDLKNGSYIATALLPWVGTLELHVALAYPSEHIRAILQFLRVFKGALQMVGKFENAKASEVTPCYHAPVIPGFGSHEICNMSVLNGSPWFCGKPLKTSLACEDYKCSRVVRPPNFKAMTQTAAEFELLERTERSPRKRIIPTSLSFKVEKKSGLMSVPPPRVTCHSINPSETWREKHPQGYTLAGKWVSLVCSGPPVTTGRGCLKGKYILILGDSNSRSHYDGFESLIPGCVSVFERLKEKWHRPLKCILILGDSNSRSHYDGFKSLIPGCVSVFERLKEKWHRPLKCVSKGFNTVVEWLPHSQPFMSYSDRWSIYEDFTSASQALDKAPYDDRPLWVILHHYVHLTPFHLSVYEVKYRAMMEAVSRLLQRRPNARVVIRGNHISWVEWVKNHYHGGDHLGPFVSRIQRDIFKGLQDRLFFVPAWYQSIAVENAGLHPNTARATHTSIFQYLCDQ